MNKNRRKAGGRPPKYTDAEQIQYKINKYFESCYITKTNKDGKIAIDEKGRAIKIQVKPFTISGLADALDMTRQSLLNYSKEKKFFDTITRAKRKCEVYAEERLFDKDGCSGAKFSLANNFANWKEKQENTNFNGTYEEYLKKVEGNEY
ncbi:MAG: hypothetical protein HFJ48_00035 [Clostridia bacterium]|nr:hypothetical protein [Clostridia bacterium]